MQRVLKEKIRASEEEGTCTYLIYKYDAEASGDCPFHIVANCTTRKLADRYMDLIRRKEIDANKDDYNEMCASHPEMIAELQTKDRFFQYVVQKVPLDKCLYENNADSMA